MRSRKMAAFITEGNGKATENVPLGVEKKSAERELISKGSKKSSFGREMMWNQKSLPRESAGRGPKTIPHLRCEKSWGGKVWF